VLAISGKQRQAAVLQFIAGCNSVPLRKPLALFALLIAIALVSSAWVVVAAPPPTVEIFPGQAIQPRVAAAPPGTQFLLKAGIHRMQTISPKDRDTFRGEPGAVLTGARELTAFSRAGSYWVADGQFQEGGRHGASCQEGYPRCNYPEQLFLDDQLLTHVGSLEEVVPGAWYFDYPNDQIYFADDPTGRRVETSVTSRAFEATASNVTVSGLVVERYANQAQSGAIHSDGTIGWVIADNEVRWNHGVGVRVGTGARLLRNNIHHNGQIGVGGGGTSAVIEGNEIAYNNTNHFDWNWEAGGAKWAGTSKLTVRGNFAHHNGGPGLWTDIDNLDTLYENNTVEDNAWAGIFHEISYAAIIRNNVVRRNGFGHADWIWGAGILIAASSNVEVYGNTLEGNADGIGAVQQARGSGKYGPYQVSNLWVHDNTIDMTVGVTGMVQDIGDKSYFTSRNNRFERNRYRLGPGKSYFVWLDEERPESEWKSYAQDAQGSFAR
jgi:parallel beta-helix repeat protein